MTMADVKKIATRDSYGNALVELGQNHKNIVVLDADLAGATKSGTFKKAFPDRHFNCGIAECNMVDVGAGLSTMGLVPFVSTFAMFAAGRAYEQVRNTIGYPHLNVKICATHGGISGGGADVLGHGAPREARGLLDVRFLLGGQSELQPRRSRCSHGIRVECTAFCRKRARRCVLHVTRASSE